MNNRVLLVAGVPAAMLSVMLTGIGAASMVSTENGIAVKETSVAVPARGMTMEQVESKFGSPTTKVPAVGKPPISRWEYAAFVVFFENNHVIHAVAIEPAAPAPDVPVAQ
jgi:hypothetical protein